jgi:predicted ATPase
VLQALGLAEQMGATPLETAGAALAGRPAIVVADNCEHLPDAVAADQGLTMTGAELRIIGEICRQLDGVPLARARDCTFRF